MGAKYDQLDLDERIDLICESSPHLPARFNYVRMTPPSAYASRPCVTKRHPARSLFGSKQRCCLECGGKCRDGCLRRVEVNGSGGEVNHRVGWFGRQRLPAVDLAHVIVAANPTIRFTIAGREEKAGEEQKLQAMVSELNLSKWITRLEPSQEEIIGVYQMQISMSCHLMRTPFP